MEKTNVKKLCNEAHEIIGNIRQAAINGEITWAQRDELMKLLLNNVADAAGLPKLAEARDLLHAWSRQDELVEAV